jgi:amino acid transporter
MTTAVISLGVAGYIQNLLGIPEPATVLVILLALSGIAAIGVKESVIVAAVITLIEVGTLLVIIFFGLPIAIESPRIEEVLSWPSGMTEWSAILSGSFLAFFAFIGFEDIENLAEETNDAQRAIPIAIILTLLISVLIYALVAIIAASWPDREAFIASHAPLADLFEQASGHDGAVISVLASIAMTNGILIQIIMASRVLYGMANEGMAPIWFKGLHQKRQTPDRAILFVGSISAILALSFPIVQIAEFTSMIVLCIFTAVNLSLFLIGSRSDALPRIKRWRYFGLIGAIFSVGLIYFSGIT